MYRRILHLIHTPRHSGAEILVRDLCLLHRKQGIDTAIASFSPADTDFQPIMDTLKQAETRLYIPAKTCSGLARVCHFKQAYNDFKPDVVYGHSVLPALYGRLALPLFGNKPRFISVLHSATNDDYADTKLWGSEILLAHRSDRIFAVSKQGAAAYKRRIPFHPPVSVVPNGTNIAQIHEACSKRDTWRAQYGLHPDDRLILQVGRLSDTKQQRLTLDALAPLLKENSNLKLWFAGLTQDADYERDLRAEIQRQSLENQVELLGGRTDVAGLLSAADLYVMPSLIESQGIAMLEALASGTAIIATEIPAFELWRSTAGVRLFPVSDENMYAAHAVELLKIGGRYQRDISQFDMNNVAAIYGDYVSKP